MIGIFDSGKGGVNTLFALRKKYPSLDITLFQDKKNAPFGKKSNTELIKIVTDGASKLLDNGAEYVLLGCCTASTVHDFLPYSIRNKVLPIIRSTAESAFKETSNKRIALLATDRTVKSNAFLKHLRNIDKDCELLQIKASELVTYIENGERDGCISAALYKKLAVYQKTVKKFGADTLILGCTHFPSLKGTFSALLPGVNIISSAECAASLIKNAAMGEGKIIYLS